MVGCFCNSLLPFWQLLILNMVRFTYFFSNRTSLELFLKIGCGLCCFLSYKLMHLGPLLPADDNPYLVKYLSDGHFELATYTKMRNHLADQVLSNEMLRIAEVSLLIIWIKFSGIL